MKKNILFLILTGILITIPAGYLSAQVKTIRVTSENNTGPGSLSDAISTAEAAIEENIRIVFDGDMTIKLDKSIPIKRSITIDGEKNQIEIQSPAYYRIFDIGFEGTITNPIILKNLTLTGGGGGNESNASGKGGTILIKDAEVKLENIIVKELAGANQASGAAIYSYGLQPLSIHNGEFSNMNPTTGVITMEGEDPSSTVNEINISGNTIFANNEMSNSGVIYVKGKKTSLKISDTVQFIDNKSKTGRSTGIGGAIAIWPKTNEAEVDIAIEGQVLFEGNSASVGGAIVIYNQSNDIAKNITMTLEGVTFEKNISNREGGAIAIYNTDRISYGSNNLNRINSSSENINVTISNCIFDGNQSETRNGGVIAVEHASQNGLVRISGSVFKNNLTNLYGGIFTYNTNIEASSSYFGDNISTRHSGAAIYSHNGCISLSDSEFLRNKSKEGGAVAANPDGVLAEGPGYMTIKDCIFKYNEAILYGGAVYYTTNKWNLLLTLTGNNTFEENKSLKDEGGAGGGGAIAIFSGSGAKSSLVLSGKSIFKGNTSVAHGGAIYNANGEEADSEFKVEISGAEFISNTTEMSGGGIYVYKCKLDINKTKFFGNKTFTSYSGGAVYGTGATDLTITGCSFDQNETGGSAGAIYSYMPNNTIKDCEFNDNKATYVGGAIHTQTTNLTIDGSSFNGNMANNGGAIYSEDVQLTIDGSSFNGNMAKNEVSSQGGGIYSRRGNISITNKNGIPTTFTSNVAPMAGAIIFYDSTVDLTDVAFGVKGKGNTGTDGAGAIWNVGGNLTMAGGSIIGNTAGMAPAFMSTDNSISRLSYVRIQENTTTGPTGGAIVFSNSNENTLINVLIADNISSAKGGALYNAGPKTLLTNVTVVNNGATLGEDIFNNGTLTLQNTIVWGNRMETSTVLSNVGSYSQKNSLVEGENVSFDGNLPGIAAHRPIFHGDKSYYRKSQLPKYGLALLSKGIDGGENSYFSNVLPGKNTDLWGNPRIINTIDMGAYEQSANSASFVDDRAACEGSSGSLQLKLVGEGPWVIGYTLAGSDIIRTVNVPEEQVNPDGIYTLSGLSSGTYTLVSVAGNDGAGFPGERYEATISSVSNPDVSAIVGLSEVYVGESISLTNATPGGIWMVDNSGFASITLGGNLTGLSAGTVEVWYVVTGSAPTNCETIAVHTVTVKTKPTDPDPEDPGPEDSDPEDPDPDPEWPPVVPEPPVDPDPDPDAWIVIQPAEACFSDELVNLQFRLQYIEKPLRYAVAFPESSKAAGFVDVKEYKNLPENNIITIALPKGVAPGRYSGYILVSEKGSAEYKMYPFFITVKDGVKITEQPEPITEQNTGERFTLSVKAQGDNLTYQWFYNGERIVGATAATYETIYDASKEGLYNVEVYGDCGWEESEKVMVTGCFNVLIKWDDVIYVRNTDGRYTKFQWYRNGEAITTHGTSIYYTDPNGLQGSYYVRAYRADGTYEQSCPVEYSTVTRSTSVSVYPTVVERNHYVTVESNELGGSYVGGTVELYNLSGGKLYTQRLLSPQIQIPVNQPTGVYILQVTAPDGRRKTQKIVVR